MNFRSFKFFKNLFFFPLKFLRLLGFKDRPIVFLVNFMADLLYHNIKPGDCEAELLHDLWQVATKEEQEVMASLILRLVEHDTKKGGV